MITREQIVTVDYKRCMKRCDITREQTVRGVGLESDRSEH